jgi:ribosomal protein S12 methylthiotransferase accessory factor
VGEIVEGYCAALYPPEIVVHAAFDELREEAVPPEAFALFSPAQYAEFGRVAGLPPYAPFTRGTRTGWVHGWSLRGRRPLLVPAPFVFLPYRYALGEPYLADAFSTGTACAATRDDATLRALCEVVERDALSILWRNMLALPEIQVDDPELDALMRERFACRGTHFRLLNATLDIPIPTVLAVFADERGGSVLGSATRLDPAEAVRKALLEAAQCRVSWKRDMVRGAGRRYAPDFHDVADFADHGRLYTQREMRRHLEFLWSSGATVPLSALSSQAGGDTGRELERCVALLADAGLEPIAIDLTTDEVRAAGLHVVRVVVPGMEGLHARHAAPFNGGRRMWEVPPRLGLRARPAAPHALNPAPHPYP